MKTWLRRGWWIVGMWALAGGCGPREVADVSLAMSAGVPIGQFRGYEATSQILRQRLLDQDDPKSDAFELGAFLGTTDPQSLPALLGGFSGDGIDNAYRNGVPNAMNTAVWYLVAQRVAGQMVAYCGDAPDQKFAGDYRLDPALFELVRRICAAATPADLSAFWDRLMGAFAPDSERDAWLAFLATQPLGGIVRTATMTVLLDPYFLLNQ